MTSRAAAGFRCRPFFILPSFANAKLEFLEKKLFSLVMNKFKYLLTAIAALTFISCGDGLKPDDGPDPAPEEKPVVKPDAASGITFSPEAPDADQPCTIYFNPTRESANSSALIKCTTDI